MTTTAGKYKYFLKPPQGKRTNWAIIKYSGDENNREYETFDDPDFLPKIKSISKDYASGVIDKHQASLLMKEILKQVRYKEGGAIQSAQKHSELSKINEAIFDSFWSERYAHKELKDEASAMYDFKRALRALGTLSLKTTPKKELEKFLRKEVEDKKKRKRIISRLNEILKANALPVLDSPMLDKVIKVRSLRLEEFKKIMKYVNDPRLEALYYTLLGTGLRLGEALALSHDKRRGDRTLYIDEQLDKKGKLRSPKRDKTGKVVISTFAIEQVKIWLDVKDKGHLRNTAQKTFRRITSKYLKDDDGNRKTLSIHDLRHSHAKWLLGQGLNITQIALQLRNRVEVCQRYYVGYELTDETVEILLQKI